MIMQARPALLTTLGFIGVVLIAGCAREEPQPTATTAPTTAGSTAMAGTTEAANVPGPYDGTWQVEAPAAGGGAASISDVSSCDGVRLQFEVKNSQIHGMLGRSPYGGGVKTSGPGLSPITGTVSPDGAINAQWQKYRATGQLTGDKAEVRWRGVCGPRVATGGRVGSAEGMGSTTTQ